MKIDHIDFGHFTVPVLFFSKSAVKL